MNRKRKDIYAEIVALCHNPTMLSVIVRGANINSTYVRHAVDAGVIVKVGEKKPVWGGPPAHIYQAVKYLEE